MRASPDRCPECGERNGGYNSDVNRRAFIAVLLITPAMCLAWGGEAHQIVALIAEDHLTPKAKAVIAELLDGAHISDAEVASWADQIRRERSNTAPWHYVDIPVTADVFDRTRDGKYGNNVIDAIEGQLKVLKDRSAPREKRQEALKFVVHFVGDIHQPAPTATATRAATSRSCTSLWTLLLQPRLQRVALLSTQPGRSSRTEPTREVRTSR